MSETMLEGVPVRVSGWAGHFIGAGDCALRMRWRIGDLRISTVGCYAPRESDTYHQIGLGRLSETMVFRVVGERHGTPQEWSEIAFATAGMDKGPAAEDLHLAVARAVARCVAAGTTSDDDISAAVGLVAS